MAFYYFKVPPHLAVRMDIANIQFKRLKDGNYMAWNIDIEKLGIPYFKAVEKASEMGILALTPDQMRQEFKGEVVRPLPQPTDPKYFPPENFDPLTGDYINDKKEESLTEESSEELVVNADLSEGGPQTIEVVIETQTQEEEEGEPTSDMVFADEDGEPLTNVHIPDNEQPNEDEEKSVGESEEGDTTNEEGGE